MTAEQIADAIGLGPSLRDGGFQPNRSQAPGFLGIFHGEPCNGSPVGLELSL